VTNSQSITYVYDGRGRMKQAGTTTYLVNGLGQRVRKNAGSDIYFAYDEAGKLIGEYDSTGAAIQETVWLGDTPVAVIRPGTPPAFTVFYIWADHLGTPRQITSTANQSRWEWAHNDPFGNNAPDENPSGAGTFAYNLRFPGQYYDSETGKHYNYFRDYDPAIGRYLQSDPIGLDGGLNTFAYAGSNSLTNSDFYGLDYWVEGAVPGESGMGQHQSICVGKRGGARSCISFGRKPSEGNCWFDCKGHVYRDRSAEGPLYRDYHRTTPPQVDAKIKKDFDKMLGGQGRWDLIGGKNCRAFSQDTFDNLVNKYGGGTGGGR
jgi:RHS repeat-associated protein